MLRLHLEGKGAPHSAGRPARARAALAALAALAARAATSTAVPAATDRRCPRPAVEADGPSDVALVVDRSNRQVAQGPGGDAEALLRAWRGGGRGAAGRRRGGGVFPSPR